MTAAEAIVHKTRWYILDTEVATRAEGYYCLCYEGDHLVLREFFRDRFAAVEFGDSWRYRETSN